MIPIGTDAWTTHPVDSGTNDPSADLLHLLDFDGTGSYTLYYLPVGSLPPSVTSLTPVSPNPASGPQSSIQVTFSEQINLASFNPSDVVLTVNNGSNVITNPAGLTLTYVSGTTYQINGLSTYTAASGVYQITVLPGVVQDSAEEPSTGSVSEQWANGNVGPYVSQIASVASPRNTPVSSVDVTFDEAINAATFTYQDVSLTLNGGSNLITNSVTISAVSGQTNTYAINGLSGLTSAAGNYVLTVNAAGISDNSSRAGQGSASSDWTVDLTPPTLVSMQQVSTNPRNTVVTSLDVTFSEPINLSTFTDANLNLSLNGGAT